MRGRKPKPSHLRVLDGTGAAGRGNVRAEGKMPTCPAHLSPSAKAEWKRLSQMLYRLGVITMLDRAVLAGYCQAYGRWVEAERKLKETPALLKMPSGYVQQNPWLTISNKQLELMHKYMCELGLSPVARTRVETRVPGLGSKFDNLLGPPKPWMPADDYLRRR
jgi:P27 family predicted phage terminase small subunit